MIRPTFDNLLLCDHGSFSISGESPFSTVNYPRSKGVLLIPSKKKVGNVKLDCVMVRKGSMDTKENLQHKLFENLLSTASGTLTIQGVSIQNCFPRVANFKKCNDRVMEYNIEFEIGKQNDYSSGVSFNQISPMPPLRSYRTGSFVSNGRTFTFGHQVEQLKSSKYGVKNSPDYRWSYEDNKRLEGGAESIQVKGWMNNVSKASCLAFGYNIIFGPMGQLGDLTVGNDSTYDAIMTKANIESVTDNNLSWNATFATTLKC